MNRIEKIKSHLTELVRNFNFHSLKWEWEGGYSYGGDYYIYLDESFINYLDYSKSGNSFLKYLDKIVRKLSRGQCYITTDHNVDSVCIVSW
jgi:hypothetical protein